MQIFDRSVVKIGSGPGDISQDRHPKEILAAPSMEISPVVERELTGLLLEFGQQGEPQIVVEITLQREAFDKLPAYAHAGMASFAAAPDKKRQTSFGGGR